jgi:hypothetical protein
MNERIVVAQAVSLQLANLAQPRIVKVTKPNVDQSISLDLSHEYSATLDLSAIVDEKLTLVQAGAKLVILFDNQSTVTAEPFFDMSGKPFANLDVELGGGRGVTGEQFAAVFPITDDLSLLQRAANGPPSGADFHNASVEPLFVGAPLALSLPLLGQEEPRNLAADVDRAPSAQNFNAQITMGSFPAVSSSSGSIVIFVPPPGGRDTTVFEAGLGARGSEPPGSHTGSPSFPTTTAGTINVISADGVAAVSLGGHALTGQPQTFADGTRGLLTASFNNGSGGGGTIAYSYKLIDNTLGDPSSVNLSVVVFGAGGDSASDNLAIGIIDDFATARPDTDSVAANQVTAETGNVLDGTGTTSGAAGADIQGADGVTVVGVAAGSTVGTVGTSLHGAHGTLTLQANGFYSYVRDANAPGGVSDVFSYTIRDGDGDLSHTTLTLALVQGNSVPGNFHIPTAGGAGTLVDEAGLATGSTPAAPSETTAGQITFTSLDGVSKIELGGLVLTPASPSPPPFTDPAGLARGNEG